MGGSVQKSADRLNRVTTLADDPGHIALSRGQMKDHPFSCLGLRKDNLVRIFDELTDDEAKELLHRQGRSSGGFLAGFGNDAANS